MPGWINCIYLKLLYTDNSMQSTNSINQAVDFTGELIRCVDKTVQGLFLFAARCATYHLSRFCVRSVVLHNRLNINCSPRNGISIVLLTTCFRLITHYPGNMLT